MPRDHVDPERSLEQAAARERAARQQIATLEQRLTEAEQQLAHESELELELRELNVELQELRADLGAARDELASTRAERDEARALIERADCVRKGIESSLSWRLTAPLRAGKARAKSQP